MRSRRDAVCRETRDPTRSDPQSHRERADELDSQREGFFRLDMLTPALIDVFLSASAG